jgi:4'-phosphopantetheinyl transferase
VHLWRAWQAVDPELEAVLEETLSDEERARAHRFVTRELTRDFIGAHGFLRDVLGACHRVSPRALRFTAESHGKPRLAHPTSPLRFNLTHSHGLAVLAIALARDLGVDVEHIRPRVAEEGVAERFFSPTEVAMLRALPPEAQSLGFFNCWTRKEAYLKALGWGLSVPLSRFDVSLAPGEEARLLADRGNAELACWSIRAFDPAPGWCGAVVVEGEPFELRLFEWTRPLALGD